MKILSRTQNGQIFSCPCKKRVSLEFGNLFLNMSEEEMRRFSEYVHSIDYEFYIHRNRDAVNRRKLLLHLGEEGVYFAVTPAEFLELKELLSFKAGSSEVPTHVLIDKLTLN
ncbi:MAG: hypothetical protein CSA95_08405 [Bacteroidetes bacterium]|nr:MAG: hypothetical protein CSA95_08405 [Bacteroidota bacterium]PIE88345.1 MAG: hypothetical protein CSA04_02405 [Bacteroidota bacterium]